MQKIEKLEMNRCCTYEYKKNSGLRVYFLPVHTAVETSELVRRAVRSAAEVGICLEAARAVGGTGAGGGALGASRRTQMTPCARDVSAVDCESAGVSHVDADVSEEVSPSGAK